MDDYSRPYRTGAQERSSRGSARQEKQEKEEQEKARMEEERQAEHTRQQEERERGHQVIESALLAEEEEEAKKRLAAICRIKKNKKKAKTDEERKRKKRRVDEEEEIEDAGEIDDIDNDPDYNPDMDFETDESMIIDDAESEILEVEKHAHCLNLSDAGEYQVWIREQLVEVERTVKAGSGVAKTAYKKFIEVLRDSIFKMGTWSPIEVADVDQVLKTVIDPSCTAWRKRMKGVKTGNCRQIWKQGEKKEQILQVAEDCEIPDSADEVLKEDTLKGKSPEEQRDIKLTIKRYFTHVRKAHEEASCAAGKLAELVDVLDKDEFCTIAHAGTRPLVILEFPEVHKLIEEKKEEVKKAEVREELRNTDIEVVIAVQNLPTPLERWKKSKVMMPTRLLAAATHYFIYSQAVQEAPMTNKALAEKFKVSTGSLHRITSGRRYAGGHAALRVQPGEHGELTVKISKKKQDKGKVAVTKVTVPTKGDVEESTPAEST